MQTPSAGTSPSSVDAEDVARFAAIAEEWWDPKGKFAPLHRLNPVRLAFIREHALAHFGRDPRARAPFAGLRLLDVGCGGGLLCEPMARLGFEVVGADPSPRNLDIARSPAARMGLEIDYRAVTVEDLVAVGGEAFDVVLNMEVVEHVAEPRAFMTDCAGLLAAEGLMILATLNRTLKSLALAKIGAEYLLRWVPPGTHDWRKFVTPEELRGCFDPSVYAVDGPVGVTFDPLARAWRRSSDADVNFMMTVART